MGSFWGHIDEGLFFIIIAVWWMVRGFKDYIICQSREEEFRPQVSYAFPGRPRIPIEIIFKICFPVIGFIGEVVDGGAYFLDDEGNFRKLIYLQHMSIYGIFILHSLTDLMTFYGVPLPKDTNYMTICLSFVWYGVAFYYHAHMHGKEPLEQVVHVLPIYPMFATALAILLEKHWKRGVWTFLARSYFVLTLGTWFSHVAFMLYVHDKFPGGEPSNWSRRDHRNVAFAQAAFGMHLCFNLMFVVILFVAEYFVVSRLCGVHIRFTYLEEQNQNSDPVHRPKYQAVRMKGLYDHDKEENLLLDDFEL